MVKSIGLLRKSDFIKSARRASRTKAGPIGDIVIGLTESAIQKFLNAHFNNNPDFYDRSRQRLPNNPIYEFSFNDHGTRRRVRFWAKVEQGGSQPAVKIDLHTPAAMRQRLSAWWRASYRAMRAASTEPPRNIGLSIPRVILQVNFPRLSGGGGENQIDLPFQIDIQTFAKLQQSGESWALQLVNWDIRATPTDDPLDPDSGIWGNLPPPTCVQEVKRLRLIIRDLFTIGANVALTQLGETLTQSLPMPPINVAEDVAVDPKELVVTDDTLAVGFNVRSSAIATRAEALFTAEIARFIEDLGNTDINEVMSAAPLKDQDALKRYMISKVPAYAALEQRSKKIRERHRAVHRRQKALSRTGSDLFISINGRVFDVLAKSLLKADQGECTRWIGIDLALMYAQGRACYWFSLKNAHGGLSGTTPTMGADFDAGGRLDLRVCFRIPCHSDECGTWSPGLGLNGPFNLGVNFDTANWDDNRALKLRAQFSSFPGFHVYGLPPGIDEIVNAVINFLSSVVLQAFVNAILSALDIYVIQLDKNIPEANVSMRLSNFSVSNNHGALVVGGTTTFS